MLFKIIIIFLSLMILIALVGRVLFPSALPRVMQDRKHPARCKSCGRPLIGKTGCDCRGQAK